MKHSRTVSGREYQEVANIYWNLADMIPAKLRLKDHCFADFIGPAQWRYGAYPDDESYIELSPAGMHRFEMLKSSSYAQTILTTYMLKKSS